MLLEKAQSTLNIYYKSVKTLLLPASMEGNTLIFPKLKHFSGKVFSSCGHSRDLLPGNAGAHMWPGLPAL